MVPPLDIILEISDQLFRCRKHVGIFFSSKMPVIAFSGLIIIAQHAFVTYDIRKATLPVTADILNRVITAGCVEVSIAAAKKRARLIKRVIAKMES